MISRQWRWLAVGAPAALVGSLELLSDTVLDPYLPFPWDTILVTLVVAALAAAFAGRTFDRMDRLTASLEVRNTEVEGAAATARALHAVSLAIASLADLDAILQVTVDSARSLLHADLGLLVLNGSDGRARLRSTSGPEDGFDRTGGSGRADPARFLRGEPPPSVLAAPLRRGGATIGTLAVAGRATPGHGVVDLETLSSLANQAAIAIENDRLAAELRQLAIRHERERIAREIHDGLAQVLGYVNTKSQAVEGLLEAGRTAEARTQMAELGKAARSIYVDVRQAIQGLTEPVGDEVELGAEIRDYATRFADASKVALALRIEPDLDTGTIASPVRDEIFGIVREALTNVRKHAAAQRVSVVLGRQDDRLVVSVTDDGRGFDADHADDGPSDWPHYGLTAMRRRAAAIDARITWTSAPGMGTTIELRVPIHPPVHVTAGGGGSR